MRPKRTWILLADATKARIAVNDGPGKGLYGISVPELLPVEPKELSDEPGLTRPPIGHDRGNINEPDLKAHVETEFAKRIIDYLDRALDGRKFHDLILIAPPQMLGILRKHLTDPLRNAVRADSPKDLTNLPIEMLSSHVEDVLAV